MAKNTMCVLPLPTSVSEGEKDIAQDFGAVTPLDPDSSSGPVVTCSLCSYLVEAKD